MSDIVIGGCGFVGAALGQQLARAGHQAWGIRRNTAELPPEILPVPSDLTRPLPADKLPRSPKCVVFAAAPSKHGPEDYEQTYLGGVRNLLEYALAAKAERFLFVSSTGVYAQQAGEWVDESSETEPLTHSGQTMLQAERLIQEARVNSCIFRCSGIYGPGRTRLIDSVRSGATGASGDVFTNRIHRDDVAGALHHLTTLADCPPLLVGSDDAPALRSEVLGWLAERMGLSAPKPSSSPAARGNHKRCSNRALKATGYRFAFPTFREGYLPMLQALGYLAPSG